MGRQGCSYTRHGITGELDCEPGSELSRSMTTRFVRAHNNFFGSVVQLEDLQVVAHNPPAVPKPGQPAPFSSKPLLHALQLGTTDHPRPKRLSSQFRGQFKKAQVAPKRKIVEFRVTEDAVLPVGTTLSAAHFVPGQHVDVSGDS